MKVKFPILLIVVLAIACGYLLGTESGRRRRDVILVKLGRADADAREGVSDAVADASEQVAQAVSDAAPSA